MTRRVVAERGREVFMFMEFDFLNGAARVRFPKSGKKENVRNRDETGALRKLNHSTIMHSLFKTTRPLLALFITLAATLTALAGDPTGTWKFKTSAGGERVGESTLTLKWDNHQLTGSIDNRAGKADIGAGTFVGDEVKFTVKREFGRRLRKKTFTVNYRGKLEGDAIKGTIETTGREKQPVSVAWEAQRVK